MKPEIKQKWTKKLRSGTVKQGLGRLRNHAGQDGGLPNQDTFCCLGVLCELAVSEGVIPPAKDINGQAFYVRSPHYLPEAVQKWAGLTQKDPTTSGSKLRKLSRLNDARKSFAEIADIIDENL